jgi:hypothetical protein
MSQASSCQFRRLVAASLPMLVLSQAAAFEQVQKLQRFQSPRL